MGYPAGERNIKTISSELDVKPTSVTEAYEYYLRVREYFRKPGFQLDDFRHAETLLQRAIEYDPEFAHAYALLSLTYSYMIWISFHAEYTCGIIRECRAGISIAS